MVQKRSGMEHIRDSAHGLTARGLTAQERPVYTYTPGDGHRYVWHGAGTIDVYRVTDILADPGAAPIDTISTTTGDGAPAFPRTVTGFTGYVDACRGAR